MKYLYRLKLHQIPSENRYNVGDKNIQHEEIENVIIELTVLKLFVQEQFYIMKK